MAENDISSLTERMATTATGWAAVIDGVLDARTVTIDKRGAAINAFLAKGVMVIATCRDDTCECMVEKLSERFPDIKLVRVTVGVAHG